MTQPEHTHLIRAFAVYDPWEGRADDYPYAEKSPDTPGSAMVLSICGVFAFVMWAVWWVI